MLEGSPMKESDIVPVRETDRADRSDLIALWVAEALAGFFVLLHIFIAWRIAACNCDVPPF